MSSAILYLAIVAIWALVLMPGWLRRSQPGLRDAEAGLPDAGQVDDDLGKAVGDSGGSADGSGDADGDEPGHAERPGGRRAGGPPARAVSPGADAERSIAAARRARVLRTRRRMLSTLLLITAGAIAMALTRVAAWWVFIPPAVLLAAFLVLLRAAVRIDAERAHAAARTAAGGSRRADAGPDAGAAPGSAADARAADARAQAGGSPSTVAERYQHPDTDAQHEDAANPVNRPMDGSWATTASPAAEIIDISGRIEDQPYDQYLDAEARAVGD